MREIAGKLPGSVKVKTWKRLEGFDPLAGSEIDIPGAVERIAEVYNLPVDVVESELDLSDLLPTYIDCVHYVTGVVFEKLKDIPKKKEN